MPTPDLKKLAALFHPTDIDWKPGAMTRKKDKALAMAYVDNRAIMDRLDDVCGPENWRNEFMPGPGGGVLCGISILVDRGDGVDGLPSREWVTKWDGAENTDVEAVKGGLSGSMKRAAAQWGIGRYLYRMPAQWVPVDERGRFARTPSIPSEFVPRPAASAPTASAPAASASVSAVASGDGAGAPAPVVREEAPSRRARPTAKAPTAKAAASKSSGAKARKASPAGPSAAKPPAGNAATRSQAERGDGGRGAGGRDAAADYFMPRDLPF